MATWILHVDIIICAGIAEAAWRTEPAARPNVSTEYAILCHMESGTSPAHPGDLHHNGNGEMISDGLFFFFYTNKVSFYGCSLLLLLLFRN